MGIQNYDTQEELDAAAERFEELCFEHLSLKEAVTEKEQELEDAKKELTNFEDDNPSVAAL